MSFDIVENLSDEEIDYMYDEYLMENTDSMISAYKCGECLCTRDNSVSQNCATDNAACSSYYGKTFTDSTSCGPYCNRRTGSSSHRMYWNGVCR